MTHRRVIAACSMLAALVLGYGTGCSTLQEQAHAFEHQIILDGRYLGLLLIQDGHRFVQLTLDAEARYQTDPAFRASIDQDIANAAIIAAKIP